MLAAKVAALASEISDLRHLGRRSEVDFDFLEFTLDTWARLLSDTHVQELYADEKPPEFSSKGTVQNISPAVLFGVESYVNLLRRGLTDSESQDVMGVAAQLFDLFAEVARRLRKQAKVPVSATLEQLLARYDFMAEMRATRVLRQQAEELVASTEKSASKASEAATSASEAAGTAGESTLASYFEAFTKDEWESATRYRVWTIRLLAIGGGLAAVFLLLPAFGVEALALEAGDYVHLAQRIIVTAAVFALAAYLARQSHQHRTLANWAKTLSVQLKTFDAFMAPLDSNDAKEALRAQFAARVFGEPPVLRGDASSEDSSSVHDKIFDILSRSMGKPQ
ncbi:hypothetical protein [Arthrobacter sp. OAP107]|uniref:hypothetical protein n=1 Tax=Arthrobacter sp. OAP107 TaxID=3156445 RepID=UPI00339173C7